MVKRYILALVVFYSFSSFSLVNNLEIIKLDSLEKLMGDSGKIRVFNFWATWCAPCVKELPYFEQVNFQYEENEIDVFLISLDFADQADKVKRFMERKNIKSKVLLLDETDYNIWIDKVSKEWSGAIPATLLIDNKNTRYFKEGEMQKEELFSMINEHIN